MRVGQPCGSDLRTSSQDHADPVVDTYGAIEYHQYDRLRGRQKIEVDHETRAGWYQEEKH